MLIYDYTNNKHMPTNTEIVKAVAVLQSALAKYENKVTEDGPYFQVGINYLQIVDCYGMVQGAGQAIEEIVNNSIDVLD